jgi:hypothetical protein
MLRSELYVKRIADLMDHECQGIREDMGLEPHPGISCENEPCLGKCPFGDSGK